MSANGAAIARAGDRLFYVVEGEAHPIPIPEALRSLVGATRWVVRAPGGGFALVGARHVVIGAAGSVSPIALPPRDGAIEAVAGDTGSLTLVTAGTAASDDDPELCTREAGETSAWT